MPMGAPGMAPPMSFARPGMPMAPMGQPMGMPMALTMAMPGAMPMARRKVACDLEPLDSQLML